MDTNKTKKKWKELGIDALFDFAGAFLQAVGVWCFIEPSRIAPGGSVIYEAKAMEHYKETATIVYLKLRYEDLESRLGNLVDRGVVLKDGMTLRDLYNERLPYYEKYADITLDETGKEFGELVDELRAYFENLEK